MQTDQSKIFGIAQEFDLKFLVYFGSYMTDFYGPESDIDIAFLSNKLLSPKEKIGSVYCGN